MEFTLSEHPGRVFRAHTASIFYQFGVVDPHFVDQNNNDNNNNDNNNFNNNNNNQPTRMRGGSLIRHIVNILHSTSPGPISARNVRQYYRRVKERVLNDDNILPGDTFHQTSFFPSDTRSGEDEPYPGDGLCIVYIDSNGNKTFGEVMNMDHRKAASLYKALLDRNPAFFRAADISISRLIPDLLYFFENTDHGVMESVARRAIQSGGTYTNRRKSRRRLRKIQTRRRKIQTRRR